MGRDITRGVRETRASREAGRQSRIAHRLYRRQRNLILDIFGLKILDPVELEAVINNVVGVVTNGLFARRGSVAARDEVWRQVYGEEVVPPFSFDGRTLSDEVTRIVNRY